ncbi:MAG: DUF1223 domain-containing protein [Proteobacteria bacterium]|nr:DUF1223 domain-containing protein [Pseudomonadota bacterium]
MKNLIRAFAVAFAVGAVAFGSHSGAVSAGEPVAVVELFTSQGCNSCPPADAMLGELTKRDDIVALSLHVDYWDYLGWKDTFGSEEFVVRQRAYARNNGRRTIYTPELVIGGQVHVVGSNPAAVKRALELAHQRAGNGLDVRFVQDKEYVTVKISGTSSDPRRAAVLLFRYDRHHDVEIERGENAGKTIAYHNVVREIRRLDTWDGKDLSIMLPIKDLKMGGRDGCAVVVQREGGGSIIGAARLALAD